MDQTATRTRSHTIASCSFVIPAVTLLWIGAQAIGVLGPLARLTLPLLSGVTITCIFVGVRINRPPVRWPWYLIAAGLGLFLVGGIARAGLGTLGDLSSHRSVIPDLITIPGYLLAIIGFFCITRARQPDRDRQIDTMLDAAVAALAALSLGWLFVVNPTLVSHSPIDVRMVLAAYPTLSVFLVAMTASLAFTAGTKRSMSNNLLLAAMIGVLAGDVVYMFVETHAASIADNIIDLPYGIGYAFLIAAVLHPSMRRSTEAIPSSEHAPTLGRLIIVAVALAIPGLITVTRVSAPIGDRIALGVVVLSLTAAAITRLFRAMRASARSEARLAHQATHDALTGLPNRAYVHEYVGSKLGAHDRQSASLVLLFLDVDRFKLINDTYGHTFGDAFLLAVALRLRRSIRPNDLVARIGGDEFVVVAELRSEREAVEFAERTCSLFAEPFCVDNAELTTSVSIGIALASGDHDTAESMIRDADTAMYCAKDAGRDSVALFDRTMRERVSRRLDLERDLHYALDRDELRLHYQPIVDMAAGRLIGFEALLRWSHPAWGMISPLSFVPVAEDTGLIVEIGAWVLTEATRQMAQWRHELPNGEDLSISVNVSARQLRDQSMVGRVQAALAASGLPRDRLTLELTESTLMEDPDDAVELLTRLKQTGINLAIDDFGTGYSSLAYLRRFPVDIVKIDRAFVMDLDNMDSSDATLVAAIVAMADALDVKTVAEGVETESQVARLLSLGCTVAQGYLYSRPAPAEGVTEMVDRIRSRARARLRPVRDAFSA